VYGDGRGEKKEKETGMDLPDQTQTASYAPRWADGRTDGRTGKTLNVAYQDGRIISDSHRDKAFSLRQ